MNRKYCAPTTCDSPGCVTGWSWKVAAGRFVGFLLWVVIAALAVGLLTGQWS